MAEPERETRLFRGTMVGMFQFLLKRMLLAVTCFAVAVWAWSIIVRTPIKHWPPWEEPTPIMPLHYAAVLGAAGFAAALGIVVGRVWIGIGVSAGLLALTFSLLSYLW